MGNTTVCVVTESPRLQEELTRALKGVSPLTFLNDFEGALRLIKKQPIARVIVALAVKKSEDILSIERFKRRFPQLPLVLYGKVADKKLSFQLGKIGIDYFISYGAIDELIETIQRLVEQRQFRIVLSRFGIDLKQCSKMIRDALKILKKDFILIRTADEIADQLNVSRCHLEREFTKACNIPLKQLLIAFQLYHATYLMEFTGLSLKEIAYHCGFAEPYGLYRFFPKKTGMPASEYRNTCRSEEFPAIFMQMYNKKQKK